MAFPIHAFSEEEKAALYRAIRERRDIRRFRPDPLPAATLARILKAAHHAPSVGFMQPWDFILIREAATRALVHAAFRHANREALERFAGQRQQQYATLKLEGILEA